MKLMIFSGTTEGHDLCRFLSKNNVQAEVFVATEYGAAVMEPMAGITVHEGLCEIGRTLRAAAAACPALSELRNRAGHSRCS